MHSNSFVNADAVHVPSEAEYMKYLRASLGQKQLRSLGIYIYITNTVKLDVEKKAFR